MTHRTITAAEARELLDRDWHDGCGRDLAATVIALHARIAEARDAANRLAVSRGIAGTKGEAALLDVRDLLAAAMRDTHDQKEAP